VAQLFSLGVIMHPAAIQLTKKIHAEFLRNKGYRLVANTIRYKFSGGCVISRLRGCSKYNRDDAARWRFQIDSRILFDDLDYDPQTWPVSPEPRGKYSGGLYCIEDQDATMPRRIADEICHLTDRMIGERVATRAAFVARIQAKREGFYDRKDHVPFQLSESERAKLEPWMVEAMDRKFAREAKKAKREI
jgi:hypothetical protein